MTIPALAHLAPADRKPVSGYRDANTAFVGGCFDFDDLLNKLHEARDAHFGADAQRQRNWGEAGSVANVNRMLAEALAFVTGTAP